MYPISNAGERGRRRPTRRSAQRRNRLLFGGAFGLLAVGAVTVLGLTTESPEVRTGDCIVGIDLSQSVTVNQGLLDQYLDWVQSSLADCAEDDAVNFAVFPVTNITRTDAVPPVTHSVDVDPEEHPQNRRDEALEWVESEAPAAVEALVDQVGAGRGGTDILAATTVAQGFFNDDADFKRLILLTDGLNTQSPVDVRTAPLDEAGIEVLLNDLHQQSRLPSIGGVSVEMYGIALGEVAETVPQDRLGQIESFWRRFFEASGGTLVAYERTYSRG